MCVYSKFWLHWERKNLSPYAVHSDHAWYTRRSPDDSLTEALDCHGSRSRYRTTFEIDKDRITNCQAFRRLEYKTQVFVTHEGDNFRTRLTHTLETAELARHIARALRLNEHLVEAIVLGHDLGHAPYGHIAEETINAWAKSLRPSLRGNYYFCHNRQSIEIVEHLEPGYDWDARYKNKDFGQGLNLTIGAREGILTHTNMGYRGLVHMKAKFDKNYESLIRRLSTANKNKGLFYPGSLEAQVVRIADDLAQRIHDLEDGFRSKMLDKSNMRRLLIEYIKDLRSDMFDPGSICKDRYLTHIKYGTKISKLFLSDIVKMLTFSSEDRDLLGERMYSKPKKYEISRINNELRRNLDYRDKFLLAAQIAFLLHMWRDDKYLDRLSGEEQGKARTRILKYFVFLREIIDDSRKESKPLPTYHIVAFLRGIMLANVIEHSFWNIHRRMNPNFGKVKEINVSEDIEEFGEKDNKNEEKWYLLFIIVDGLIKEIKGKIYYVSYEKKHRRCCFEFSKEEDMNQFISKYFKKIMATNGTFLDRKALKDKCKLLKSVRWLNKSEKPLLTEFVKLSFENSRTEVMSPLKNVRIYFTGYKELCPGAELGLCDYSPQPNKKCPKSSKCQFWSEKVKYPDISRMVEFQDSLADLDSRLKKLISERIHKASRIARMNYMGKKIIRELLDIYLENPRIMHDRVWTGLRIYPEMDGVSPPIREWTECSIDERERRIIPEEVLNRMMNKEDPEYEYNRYSLIRRIIEHISGMTDRFIANEYNRVNQSGREVELQDESYFFS